MTRLFNVKSDAAERRKIINSLERLRAAKARDEFAPVVFYRKMSNWKIVAADKLIAHYEQRLKELN